MGINLVDAKLILEIFGERKNRFDRVLTLGRQQLFFNPRRFAHWAQKHTNCGIGRVTNFLNEAQDGGVADPLFKLLGVGRVESLDYSSYEGASICHDLNRPIPDSLKSQFDLVFDGGTLEHVFNFPVALKNAMELVRPGGFLLSILPGNNQVGHGFYQFSPELFHNALNKVNGFELLELIAIELSPFHRCYRVTDPATLGERVTLTNRWPVNLFILAEKISDQPVFATPPLQSDYQLKWKNQNPREATSPGMMRRILRKLFGLFRPEGSGFRNPQHFTRIHLK
ncbi:MAG: hypothetical protein A2Z97_00650 [Bdellovibrionales bacterium GWB1_52_6]|nr:MAG: hypothetical protein A2Z97_00650 [Bdellovibrionales bacterium GWB1_52_6]